MLVGLMATGKTTVASLVADGLARQVVDSDAQVEARTGRSVRALWRDGGEAAFRTLESEALDAALDATAPSVVAAAGGVVLAERNRRRLRDDDAFVVWLRAEVATLLDRLTVAGDTHRPLLDDDPSGTLADMASTRAPLYAEVADAVVDVDGRTPAAVADAVLDGYRRAVTTQGASS